MVLWTSTSLEFQTTHLQQSSPFSHEKLRGIIIFLDSEWSIPEHEASLTDQVSALSALFAVEEDSSGWSLVQKYSKPQSISWLMFLRPLANLKITSSSNPLSGGMDFHEWKAKKKSNNYQWYLVGMSHKKWNCYWWIGFFYWMGFFTALETVSHCWHWVRSCFIHASYVMF